MSRLKGAALDRAVANAMGLKSVHNCEKWGEHMIEEDEEFQRLEREAKMRRMAEEDDDIQVYKKPWVGLTEWEREAIAVECGAVSADWLVFIEAVEKALKEKNT